MAIAASHVLERRMVMSGFSPADFGRAFEKIQMEYQTGIGAYLAPFFHLMAVLVLCYHLLNKKKNPKLFNIWFAVNYLWIFSYVGIYMFYRFYQELGVWSVAFWGVLPLLLGNIFFNWVQSARKSTGEIMDWDFFNIPRWRWLITPFIAFGFWYPTYIYGQGFVFTAKDLLFSFFGLMPCPTTIVTLGILTLKYPAVHKGLYNALTLFAVWIGSFQILLGYVPDYPLAMVGYYSLGLIISDRCARVRRNRTGVQE